VTQRANAKAAVGGVFEQTANERLPDLSGSAGNQNAALVGLLGAFVSRSFLTMNVHGSTSRLGQGVGLSSTGCIGGLLRHSVKWKLCPVQK
jgi:hypothetical protein